MSQIIRPTWPLGLKFIDSKRREFEVVLVIMGNPDLHVSYEVEMNNGWKVIAQSGEHPQTQAGFVETRYREKVITELITDLDQFVKNGHLKILGYDLTI